LIFTIGNQQQHFQDILKLFLFPITNHVEGVDLVRGNLRFWAGAAATTGFF
jgi:hypothetical protein